MSDPVVVQEKLIGDSLGQECPGHHICEAYIDYYNIILEHMAL